MEYTPPLFLHPVNKGLGYCVMVALQFLVLSV